MCVAPHLHPGLRLPLPASVLGKVASVLDATTILVPKLMLGAPFWGFLELMGAVETFRSTHLSYP